MPARVQATNASGHRFSSILGRGLEQDRTKALGIAVAYVSIYGFNYIDKIVSQKGIVHVNLIADISDCVTHPNALEFALNRSWGVRVVDNGATFHPKLYIGCKGFDSDNNVVDTSFIIISSANLSYGGIFRNTECSFIQTGDTLRSCAPTWQTLWSMGEKATKKTVAEYQKRFSERNRRRRSDDLVALGVADKMPEKSAGIPSKTSVPPTDASKATSETTSSIAWAGLQSFTGDYRFQVEFPQKAALVLKRLLSSAASSGAIDISCSDGERRTFKFRFYDKNGMFRLNVPNDVPNAEWARSEKAGIAFVEVRNDGDVYFEIMKPGRHLDEIIDHSLALGTWGRTSTRLYGWY